MRKEKEVESKVTQKREDKEMIQLHNGLFELKRELKKHEALPASKAHGKSQKDAPLPNMRKY